MHSHPRLGVLSHNLALSLPRTSSAENQNDLVWDMWIYMAHEKSTELGIATQAITLNPLWAKKSKAPWGSEAAYAESQNFPPISDCYPRESTLFSCIMLLWGMCDSSVHCISVSLGYSCFSDDFLAFPRSQMYIISRAEFHGKSLHDQICGKGQGQMVLKKW